MSGRDRLVRRFRRQAEGCRNLGSPLYAGLLERAADDLAAGGPTWDVMRGSERDPPGTVPALRLMGAVHRLALAGEVPELAAYYPSCGGTRLAAGAWPPFRAVLVERRDALRAGMREPVQTNEVRRCAALLPGFAEVAATTGLPLRVLEVGSSGGLNLRFDRYRYEADGVGWGDPASPVHVRAEWDGVPAPGPFTVAERAGCDLLPVDPSQEAGRRTLLSFVWADQAERIALLRAALAVSASSPAEVDRAGAVEWLEPRLADPVPRVATVVFHSIVMQYLPAAERDRVRRTIAAAGERATLEAPVAWLRLEPGEDPAAPLAELRLARWPGGDDRLLAHAGYHGAPVRWVG